MFQYPFCARCGEFLYEVGFYIRHETSCCKCYSYKIKPNGKVSSGFLYVNPNPKILYMDFEYDMQSGALMKSCRDEKGEWDFNKECEITKNFKQCCEDFYNNVVIKNPDFSPAIRERVLEDNKRNEAERAKKEAESQKKLEEYRKQRAKEKAYEATHPKPKCPTCGSTNIEKISTLNRAVSIRMVGLASDKIGKQFCCKNCGYKW